MSSSLRVVYDNVFDTANVLVSNTASASTTAANLKLDLKSLVWRSALTSSTIGTTEAHISLGFPQYNIISCIIFAYTNFTAEAVARVKLYSGTGTQPNLGGTVDDPTIGNSGANTVVYDTGGNNFRLPLTKYAAIDSFNWGYDPMALTGYEDRRGYSVIWLPEAARIPFNSMALQLYNVGTNDHYIEISRVIMGNYWSPKYNMGFGLSTSTKDLSTSDRNEAGDLITNNGAIYNSMNFDMQYMDSNDRTMLNKLVRSRGTKKPIFISLFPENNTDYVKENMYQMYGKLAQTPEISHPIFETYSSQIEIEEV